MTDNSAIQPGESRPDKIFNFIACLIDGFGWPVGMAFFSFTTILPVFLGHLGAQNTTVGALIAIVNILMFGTGFLVVRHVSQLPRARGFLLVIALIERAALIPLIPLTVIWGVSHPRWLLIAFFVCFTIHAIAMGLNQPAYWTVIGKTVPLKWRGRLFGYAGGIAGLMGFGVDALLKQELSGPDGGFPAGYSHGFLVGIVILFLTVLPLGIVREPWGIPPSADDPHTGHYRQDSLYVWRTNTHFRRFIYSQILFMLVAMATPYYVLYAQRQLHAGPTAIAGYTAAMVFAAAFGGLGWGAWSDKVGNKAVIVASICCAIFATLLACLTSSTVAFYGVFIASALATSGVGLAGTNLVLEYAPEARDIPLYTTLFNAITSVPRAVAPLLGGLIADHLGGYRPAFAVAFVLAILGLLLTLRMSEPRKLNAEKELPPEVND